MSRQRRNFSAKFKSDLVIELLKGEKDLNTLAAENNIQPNLLRNWKKEFLSNAAVVFDDKREENLKEKLAEERKEKAEYAKKVGQLTMQVDWLKKNLKKFADLTTRVSLVQNLLTTKGIPVSVGATLPRVALHWEKYFQLSVAKYNKIYRVQLPKITPHVCRHKFCTNMAKSGMNRKVLQYIMGHGDISVTLDTYTHIKSEDAIAEMERLDYLATKEA